MPTPSFALRCRSSRRASAVRPLPARRLRSEAAAATSATSALADVGCSRLGGGGAWSEDGIRALLAAVAAMCASSWDSTAGGGRPLGGRPRKQIQRGKRKRLGFHRTKGKKKGSIGKAQALVALAAAPAAVHAPPGIEGTPTGIEGRVRDRVGRGRKGRWTNGQFPQDRLDRDAGVVVSPAEPRPWVFQWEGDGNRALQPTPPPAATHPPIPSFARDVTITRQARRQAVACFYLWTMDAPPASEDNETVTDILTNLGIPRGSYNSVKNIILDARSCYEKGEEYTGEKRGSDRMMLAAIPPGSVAALIIAESMEDGAGIRCAHADAMHWLRRRQEAGEENVEYWGLSATYSCFLRMKPTVSVVQKRSQGSDDPESAWCQACLGWVTQLLVRTGVDIPPEWGGPLTEEEKKLPWFNKTKLTLFSPHQVAEWDETHQDLVMLGGSGRSRRGKEIQVRFHRMPDGTIDTTGGDGEGSTLSEQRNRLSVKYDKQVRFLLGTASVQLPDRTDGTHGTVEGRRCAALEYTERFVLTHEDFSVRMKTEIGRVRTLEGEGAPWVTGKRTAADGVFDEDPLTKLFGAGAATETLLQQWEVLLVSDVACLEDADVVTLGEVDGLGVARLEKMRTEARAAHPGKFDRPTVNHKLALNPYESLYGNSWRDVIKKTTYMMKFLNVRDLVMHMTVQSDEVMRGTVYEGHAMFKHDALSLMTATKTMEWMKETEVNGRTIFERWLLPQEGLNDFITADGETTTRYRGRPPGNLPRLMSLDECGNKNLMDCVNSHVSATKKVVRAQDVNTDPKFELCDTVRASRAMLRCWDPQHGPNGGAPTSKNINASHERVWGKHLGEIRMARGRMVGGRSGHRRAEVAATRGGARERGPAPYTGEMEWLHPDARLGQDAKIERCAAIASGQAA